MGVVVLLVASLLLAWRRLHQPAPVYDQRPLVGLGQTLVDEASRVLQDRGGIVVVLMGDPKNPVMPANGLWDGFRDELKKHSGLKTLATEFVEPDPSRLNFCSPAVLQQVLDRHPEADAFVFFTALPPWGMAWETLRPNPDPKIKLIVVDTDQTFHKLNYRGYFINGMLVSLIGPRTDQPPALPAGVKTPRDSFSQKYQIFTPQNYESLPE